MKCPCSNCNGTVKKVDEQVFDELAKMLSDPNKFAKYAQEIAKKHELHPFSDDELKFAQLMVLRDIKKTAKESDSNFNACVDCGCVIYKCARDNEPSWVTNYWRQVPKEWKKEGVEE